MTSTDSNFGSPISMILIQLIHSLKCLPFVHEHDFPYIINITKIGSSSISHLFVV